MGGVEDRLLFPEQVVLLKSSQINQQIRAITT